MSKDQNKVHKTAVLVRKSFNIAEVCHPPYVHSINTSYYVLYVQSVTTQQYCQ